MILDSDNAILKVLIIDDEPFMRRTIRVMLRAVGRFVVEDADDGEAAMAIMPVLRPDLVLCDIHMPRMDGLQFVEHLRNHREESLRGTPVLMLTISADAGTIMSAARLKIDGYLVKPVSPKQIAAHISRMFRGHEARFQR